MHTCTYILWHSPTHISPEWEKRSPWASTIDIGSSRRLEVSRIQIWKFENVSTRKFFKNMLLIYFVTLALILNQTGKCFFSTIYSGAVRMWSLAIPPKSSSVLESGISCGQEKSWDLSRQWHEFAALRRYIKHRYLSYKAHLNVQLFSVPSVIACVLSRNGRCWKSVLRP